MTMLQGSAVADPAAPLVTDGFVPEWMQAAREQFATFSSAEFSGTCRRSSNRGR
jgi:hypothetical protein